MKREPSNKNLVFVDRTIFPEYPDWVERLEHPELESTGPPEFDAGKLEQWTHNDQKIGQIKGDVLLQYLKEHDMLKKCLSLRDLEEIQKKGITFFQRNFKKKMVFAWKSAARNDVGFVHVPCIYIHVSSTMPHTLRLRWYYICDDWGHGNPVFLFKSLCGEVQKS